MKISFLIEIYDDMVGQPFILDDYLACRLTIFVQQNGVKHELCNSTFHDALLLGIGKILLEYRDKHIISQNCIETFENAMEYTFIKSSKWLIIKAHSEFHNTTELSLQCDFEDFFFAFFNEYERYFKNLLMKDSNATKHSSVEMMEHQIKTYTNLKI